jgi:hypothetical protein
MFRNFDEASSFHPTHQNWKPAGCASQATAASPWPALSALLMMGDALCEGLAAHRQYEALRSRGIPHDRALRQSLGLGFSQLPRETVKPLYFAGRA